MKTLFLHILATLLLPVALIVFAGMGIITAWVFTYTMLEGGTWPE